MSTETTPVEKKPTFISNIKTMFADPEFQKQLVVAVAQTATFVVVSVAMAAATDGVKKLSESAYNALKSDQSGPVNANVDVTIPDQIA